MNEPPSTSAAGSLRFPKSSRLLSGPEFDTVFAERLSAGDGVLVVHARPNGLGRPRLGLAVSRKVGPAVRRNRWKRLLREAFRVAQHDLPNFDLVAIPRSRDEPTLPAIDRSLRELTRRLVSKSQRRTPPATGATTKKPS